MRKKKYREIHVFSLSAIDFFCCAMAVFIFLLIITIPFYTKTSKISEKQIQELQEEIKHLEDELKVVKVKNSALAKELKPKPETPTPKVVTPPDLSKKVEDLLAELEKLRLKIQQLEREKLALETELAQVKQKNVQLEAANRSLQDANKKLEIEVARLQKELEELKAKQGSSFLVVVLKWSTDRHDIDLEVTTPEKFTYNFKNRTRPNGMGVFALDSRTGPGAELWQSAQAVPGDYMARVNFYNNYGNKAPALVSLTLLSRRGKKEAPAFSMDFNSERAHDVRFSLDADGVVTFK